MSSIVQQGGFNTAALGAPGIVVQILQPSQNLINGVATNVIGKVGVGSWGPINSPTVIGSPQQQVTTFGPITNRTYDLSTAVSIASLQGSVNFMCVRVADGSQEYADANLLDVTTPAGFIGLVLTAKYTGIVGNTIKATISTGSQFGSFKLVIALPNIAPEIFDNISGSGVTLWQNMANAVNLGQSSIRPPSQLAVASVYSGINGVTSIVAGSYTVVPTLGATVGTGATLAAVMKAVTATISAAGTGYVPADTITLTGGTHATASVLTVATTKVVSATIAAAGSGGTPGTQTVTGTTGTGTKFQASVTVSGGGAITAVLSISVAGSYTVNPTSLTTEPVTGASLTGAQLSIVMGVDTATISTAGSYTALPSNPVAQGSTSGSGTGATFTMAWGILSVTVSVGGTGYTQASVLTVSGSGGGSGTLVVGSAINPAITSYTLAGGLDGADVTSAELLGDDSVTPRTGMYALRSTNCDIVVLVDCTDSATWTDQDAFGLAEGAYMMLVDAAGQTIAQTITTKNGVGLDSYASKLLLGDWCYWFDSTNNVTRVVSPQSFVAGCLAARTPQFSSLNQKIFGIVATQTSFNKQVYNNAQVTQLVNNGLDVILNPAPGIPGSNYFATATGQNTSSVLLTNDDNYTRLTNFLALSFASTLGRLYVGQPNSVEEQQSAATVMTAFLQNLKQPPTPMIKDFDVTIQQTANPYLLEALVRVVDLFTIRTFLVNLQTGDTSLVDTQPAPVQFQ